MKRSLKSNGRDRPLCRRASIFSNFLKIEALESLVAEDRYRNPPNSTLYGSSYALSAPARDYGQRPLSANSGRSQICEVPDLPGASSSGKQKLCIGVALDPAFGMDVCPSSD
ncbi:hypothetical protein [Microvirga calopogonii]|uniref:hypothetical protein n=1 Tax=Microvirga calopogonii TaxID=2078013 RepID=UPI0013B43387|nr:hypothetical protein [Microvirga calopogonii]